MYEGNLPEFKKDDARTPEQIAAEYNELPSLLKNPDDLQAVTPEQVAESIKIAIKRTSELTSKAPESRISEIIRVLEKKDKKSNRILFDVFNYAREAGMSDDELLSSPEVVEWIKKHLIEVILHAHIDSSIGVIQRLKHPESIVGDPAVLNAAKQRILQFIDMNFWDYDEYSCTLQECTYYFHEDLGIPYEDSVYNSFPEDIRNIIRSTPQEKHEAFRKWDASRKKK